MKTRTLKRDVLFQNRIYRLVRSVIRHPGREPVVRDCIEHPGAVAIVPLLPGNRVVLIRPRAVPLATALRWAGGGRIRDAKTRVGLAPAARVTRRSDSGGG
jgi:ADP-ribose pyrophosphatase